MRSMTHRLSPLLLVLVWPAFACGAGSTPVEVWSSPTIDRLELADSHALQPVLNAWLTSDCTGVIERSVALRGWISEAVADAFHPAQGGPPSAAQMRSALSEYVYATPPVVEIGEHGFRSVVLHMDCDDDRARHLYEDKFGFVPVTACELEYGPGYGRVMMRLVLEERR